MVPLGGAQNNSKSHLRRKMAPTESDSFIILFLYNQNATLNTHTLKRIADIRYMKSDI